MRPDEMTRSERFLGAVGNAVGGFIGGVQTGILKQSPIAGALFDSWKSGTGAASAEPLTANQKAYQVSAWVYACVYAIASQGASVPLMAYRATSPDRTKWDKLPGHEILEVLQNPNPDAEESDFDLMEALFSDWELSGEWFLYTQRRDDGFPERIYRLRPDLMKVVPSKARRVAGYKLCVNGETVDFERDEVTQSKTFNPLDDLHGMSSLRAAQLAVTMDTQAQLSNLALLKDRSIPPGFLVAQGKLTSDKKKQLKEQWGKDHRGSKVHRMGLLEGGMTYQAAGLTPQDMEFVLQRKMSREEIMACFHVPPALVGVMEYSNYANMDAQMQSFWHNTMIPKVRKMQRALTRGLCRPYDRKLVLEFDLTKVWALIQNALEMAKVDAELTRSGIYTINERRAERGLEPKPWGDVAWMQIQYQPVSGPEMSFPGLSGKGLAHDGAETLLRKTAAPIVKGKALYGNDVMKAGRDLAWEVAIAPSRGQFAKKVVTILGKQQTEVLENINAEKRSPTELRRWVQKRAESKAEGSEITDALITDAARVEAEVWLFDYEYWQTGSIKAVHPTLLNAINEGGKFGLLELGLDMDFDLVDPLVQRELKLKEFVFAEKWNESTLLQLREELAQGIVNGENKVQLTERVSKVFGHEKKNAGVVAQTEVGAVSNAGAIESYRQSSVVPEKQWHTSGPNPRPDHIAANGQIVPLDQEFQVGGEGLRYPGDPNGQAKNVCNCHCSVLPVVADVEG